MPSASYSFLDVVVLDDVRERFAAGEALVILSQDLEEVIWANGPGAVLFGYDNIEEIIGASARLGFVAKRQIKATSGFPAIGRDRSILMRMTTGLSSSAVLFLASAVTLPDGEEAILLAAGAGGDRNGKSDLAISGFSEAGHFVALVDADGAVVASSDGFSRLGLGTDVLSGMIQRLSGSQGRIAKRMLAGPRGPLPAGLARLTDTPARHFLVVVDEGQEAEAQEPTADEPATETLTGVIVPETERADEQPSMAAGNTDDSPPALDDAGLPIPAPETDNATAVANAPLHQSGHDSWYFSTPGMEPTSQELDDAQQELSFDDEVSNAGTPDTAPPAETWTESATAELTQVETAALPTDVTAEEEQQPQESDTLAPDNSNQRPAEPAAERILTPVRFVWRTDAEGKFSQLSPEFARAVGKEAADIVGRNFEDVALAFGLDPAGEIAGLLARRDTWSGRSVFWPVSGTDLKIPVDLAALPVYNRTRVFEGFRGFGVARGGDAVADSEGLGLVLTTPTAPKPLLGDENSEEDVATEPPANDDLLPADPFQGEVPALSIAPMPDRRFTDKVIRLAEHRQPANDKGLTTGERIAFQQIGERLKKDVTDPVGVETSEAANKTELEPAAEALGDLAAPEFVAANDLADFPAEDLAEKDRKPEPETGENVWSADGAESTGEFSDPPLLTEEADAADLATEEAETVGTVPDAAELTLPQAEDELVPAVETGIWTEEAAAPSVDGDSGQAPVQTATVNRRTPRSGMSLLDFAALKTEEQPGSIEAGRVDALDFALGGSPVPAPFESLDASPEPEAGQRDAVATTEAEVPNDDAADAGIDSADPISSVDKEPDAEVEAPAQDEQIEAPQQTDEATLPHYAAPPLKADEVTTSESSAPTGSDTSILEKLPVPVLVHSGDVLHYANGEFLTLTGYASIQDLAAAGGIGALFADPYENEDDEDRADRQLRLKSQSGDEFPVEAFLQSVPWNGGKALLLVLSRTKENAFGAVSATQSPLIAELEARVAEMRTIIDTATDGVVLIARDGTVRSISRPAEALFGFDSDDVAGKPFASLFAIESQRAARDYLSGLSDNGVASVLNDGREVIGRESQGRFIPLFMTIGRLPSDSGFCAVVRDITQWKRAEEELTQARAVAERASSHKTDFLARVSHEIRTPLNAIIGFSELMMDEKFGPVTNDRYRDYLRDINRSGNHVLDLVNDLLDISKIEAGQQEMAYEAVSLNDTLAETVAMMQPQANRERVIIRSSFASKLPDVVADLRSVRQIALNILSNAVRYTQAGGQVIVSTAYETTGDVAMRVRDTGIGMTQAEIEQALKPFKQINSLKRARGDGTGLGLPLTKAMVEANRAKFVINSSPGEGTLVEITFPSTRVLAD